LLHYGQASATNEPKLTAAAHSSTSEVWYVATIALLSVLVLAQTLYIRLLLLDRAAAANAASAAAAEAATAAATTYAATTYAAANSDRVVTETVAVLLRQQSAPLGLWSVNRAAHAEAKRFEPITVMIGSGMSAATMHSLLQRTTVAHVCFDAGCEQAPAMATALIAALRERSTASTAARYTALTSFTLRNFNQLNSVTLSSLIAALPGSVSNLSLLLQLTAEDTEEDDNVYSAWDATRVLPPTVNIPDCVRSLTVRNVQQNLHFSPHSKLSELHIEGLASPAWMLPESLRTVTVQRAVVAGRTLLPDRMPLGVQLFDVSDSDIVHVFTLSDNDNLKPLPDTVTVLKLPHKLRYYSGHIPKHLEVLDTGFCFRSCLGVLPPTLKELYIKRKPGDEWQYVHDLGVLPDSLKVLQVANMKHSLGVLPDTLEVLHCTNHAHELGMLPSSLKVLKIDGSNFNHSLGLLPDGLVELDLCTAVDFQQPLGILPASLQTIKLHSDYMHADAVQQHRDAAAAAAAQHAAVVEKAAAVIDEPVQTNTTKWFRRAAAAVTAAAVTTAVLYGSKLMVISYLLRSI
jgi:hypothetical protein